MPFPETIKKAQEVYQIFIEHFAWIATPLYNGLKKQSDEPSHHDLKAQAHIHSKQQFPDTPETHEAFQLLQQALASSPILIHPDFEREFTLYIDMCARGIAGSIHQI